MTTPTIKAARAAYDEWQSENHLAYGMKFHIRWDDLPELTRQHWMRQQRAALLAIGVVDKAPLRKFAS